MAWLIPAIILQVRSDRSTRYLRLDQREKIMTKRHKSLVQNRLARQRSTRVVGRSWLHEQYTAVLAEPLPADMRGLVAELVALEAGRAKTSAQILEVLQLDSPLSGR
jgi:hypothetical protein